MTAALETKEFQAEVKKLLDIVIHSLYTEKDIFLRELISNAADALEKLRHQKILEPVIFDADAPLEINITFDDKAQTLTIIDSGLGMTREELIDNLGTIAHSGSRKFLANLTDTSQKEVNLIGQFGVGFYSAFMVAKRVSVQSRSYREDADGYEWASEGVGNYVLSPCAGLHRGTKVIIELRDDAKDYANEETIKRIIKQYSNFVPFPIKVKSETINTVQAIWTRGKSEITDKEYEEFYKFIANAFDEPRMRLHFTADAPLAINALLYVPVSTMERLGFGRIDPGVNLYCRRVLIEGHSKEILPDWLRFLKGVIDSEDLPLNISRQALQDNALVAKINKVVTKRFLKFLGEQAKEQPDAYDNFWTEFGFYMKEGATTDYTHREEIAKLLRFETSKTEPKKTSSFADYVSRMREGQNEIYYINGPTRESVETGPYIEAFRRRDIEIIYNLDPIDDFVFSHLREFDGKKLVSADRADLKLPEGKEAVEEGNDKKVSEHLGSAETKKLTDWMKEVLGERVKEVMESSRLVDSPAMIVNPDGFITSSMERIMRAARQEESLMTGGKNLEINTGHNLIKGLLPMKERDEEFARAVVEQVFDNAMIQAGLGVESLKIVERSYKIIERAISK